MTAGTWLLIAVVFLTLAAIAALDVLTTTGAGRSTRDEDDAAQLAFLRERGRR